ncbi:DTW domain-containing protein [Chromatiaceae bacterium AAb-1]|nr:DTW domain-containing protein [Chromatiaceae bacterium AAb-1]
MQFCLLTHSREFQKNTNTGKLVAQCPLITARQILWQRKAPDPQLLQQLQQGNAALVYPATEQQPSLPPRHFSHLILLDATWQEAAKMLRQSPYLQQAPRVSLTPQAQSAY